MTDMEVCDLISKLMQAHKKRLQKTMHNMNGQFMKTVIWNKTPFRRNLKTQQMQNPATALKRNHCQVRLQLLRFYS